jgi:RNA polymerase sigma-70 factor (ECF subfamily)
MSADGSGRGADVDLMRRAGSGDREAQRLVAVRLMRRVQRLARALLHDRDEANDASQLSLLEILRSAHHFRGDSELEGWADRIVVRTTLRHARRGRRLVSDRLEEDLSPSVAASSDHSVAAAEYLALLSEGARALLLLRCGLEYSIEEIAELTQVSPNTVKDRLKRARACLRSALDERPDPKAALSTGKAG